VTLSVIAPLRQPAGELSGEQQRLVFALEISQLPWYARKDGSHPIADHVFEC
jgi:hypothetical protein